MQTPLGRAKRRREVQLLLQVFLLYKSVCLLIPHGYLILDVELIFAFNWQGLRNSRSLIKGKVDLQVANGARVAALAIGTY